MDVLNLSKQNVIQLCRLLNNFLEEINSLLYPSLIEIQL
jgi:hypothetical protein